MSMFKILKTDYGFSSKVAWAFYIARKHIERFTPSDWKDTGIRKYEFVTKT